MPRTVAGKDEVNVLRAKNLTALRDIIHGFSTRAGGQSSVYGGHSLNLGFTKQDSKSTVENNRATFLKSVGAAAGKTPWPLVSLRQIHSDIIHYVKRAPESQLVGDGLITSTPRIALAVQTADCLPIILVDPKHPAVGVFHAGWRGTLRRIVEKGVGEMVMRFGSDPRGMSAAIGPGVRSCCYEVGPEVEEKFESQFAYAADLFRELKESDPVREKYPLLFLSARPPGHSEVPVKLFLDLVEANRRQLIDAGIPPSNVEALPFCTCCRVDLLFSHRAEKGGTGRMMGMVGIRS